MNKMKKDSKVTAVVAGVPTNIGFTSKKRKEAGKQFIDVGIAEEHAVAMISGIAKNGCKPVFATYSSFIQRTYDQISQDLCINRNPAVISVFLGGSAGMNDETHLGFYSAAVTIAELWEFVPSAAVNSARPLILSRREGNYKEYERRFQLLLLGITCMGVAVSIAFMFLGDLAIKILYGKDYMEASIPLTILIWSTAVAAIGYARNVWFVAEDCQSYVKYFTIAGAVFDFVANLWFIPVFGIKGAAITTALSHIIVGFIAPLFVKKTRKFVALYFKSFLLFPDLIKIVTSTLKKKG